MSKTLLFRLLRPMFVLSLLATGASAQAATSACRLPEFAQEVQCGKIQRPLNPAQPDGKKIDVHYVVLPSQDRNKLQDAVFLLAGGPGQSAINVASWGQAILSRLNRRRDLVFVDQRGTGRSAPLHCPELENAADFADNAAMQKMAQSCMKTLQALPYGELQYFSTSIAVQDLEAVRRELAYSAVNLVGASYGTRVGLEYLRQFPKSVKRLVLDGVVPPDLPLASLDAQKALDGVFADCEKTPQCTRAYPDLAQRWTRLLDSLPQQIKLKHPRLSTEVSVKLTRDSLLGLVHKTLYASSSTAALPYALTQAERGNYAPLVTLSGALSLPGPAGIVYGMHLSVMCAEAYAAPAKSVSTKEKDDFEKATAAQYKSICAEWPRAEIPAGFLNIPVSAAPALLLSGGIDPVTPIPYGATVAQALGKNARHISIQNSGHGLLVQGCVRDLVYRFLSAKSDPEANAVDATCVRQIPRPLAWQAPQSGNSASAKAAAAGEKP